MHRSKLWCSKCTLDLSRESNDVGCRSKIVVLDMIRLQIGARDIAFQSSAEEIGAEIFS
ncbi:hypothetical protein CASFOL_005928 [Castilleja foliolosa]|uniref:Uncharacterized protein n=1 Tax=Castilleja foliolosa TaxID=1961234 RepID=A0ABD3E8U3_9LAMI